MALQTEWEIAKPVVIEDKERISMRRTWPDWAAILALGLLPLFYFAPTVFGGQTFYFQDISIDYLPLNAFNTQTLGQGELPLWNPYLNGGFPFAGQPESAPLYPFNLIFLLPLPITTTHTWYIVIHYMLAGMFTYLLVRRGLGLSVMPAFIAGIVFAFNGTMIAGLTNVPLITTLIWLPLILFLYIRALDTAKPIYAVGAGLVMAVQISKSHPQMVLYTAGVLALYALFAGGSSFRAGPGRARLWPLGALLIVFSVSAGLSAYQLLYTFELIQQSNRSGGMTYTLMTILSYPPLYLLKFLIPHFWGSFQHYVGNGNYTGMHAYAGILPLILTMVAWFKPKDWRVWFFTTLLALCLLLSFGKFTPLYTPLQYVPIFNYFRVPARWLYLAAFCLAILAAYGAQALINRPTRPIRLRLVPLLIVGLPAVIGGAVWGDGLNGLDRCDTWRPACFFASPLVYADYNLWVEPRPAERDYLIVEPQTGEPPEAKQQREETAFKQRVRLAYGEMQQSVGLFLVMLALGVGLVWAGFGGWLWGLLAGLLVLLDLLTYGGLTLNPTTNASYFLKEPDTVQFLKQTETKEPYRIFPTINWLPYPYNLDYVLSTLHFNFPALYGIESIEGGATLPLTRHTDYMKRAVGQAGGLRMLGLANVKYIITEWDLTGDPNLVLVFQGRSQKIYQNLLALPRAFVVHRVEVEDNPPAVLNRLADPAFEPGQTILLEEPPAEPLPTASPGTASTVQMITHRHNRVTLKVSMTAPGFLFLGDIYYPGWNAYVDGQSTPTYQADYLFRAVELGPGEHTVEFRYEPQSFQLGLGLTLLTVILVGFYSIRTTGVRIKRP